IRSIPPTRPSPRGRRRPLCRWPTDRPTVPARQRVAPREGAGGMTLAPPVTGRPGPSPRPWRWPGWRHIGYAAQLELATGVWLGVVFYGAEYVAGRHGHRVPVHLPFEASLPLVPAFVLAYLSIHLVFALAPFALPTRDELRALMRALAVAIGIAGLGFLLLPGDLAYPPPPGLGIWERPFRLADMVNGDHNLVPSLHVALSIACLSA